ncbi:MAG: BTAD domain-containing putative transcriptional regulator [Sciscionella sp.]
MRFRLLGAIEFCDEEDRPVPLGARQRAVLAALLLHANQVVSAGTLINMVWEDPPRSAEANLRTHVASLRRRLGNGDRLVTRSGGYLLTVDPGAVDLHRFRELMAGGERAFQDGDPQRAEEQLTEALALWRGEAFENLACTTALQVDADRLEEERLVAVERHAEVRLALGQHDELVPHLRGLVAAHPLRERFWAQLMLALYRNGQQADALGAYGEIRRHLSNELGIEPGPELRELSARMLDSDRSLIAPGHSAPVVSAPRQAELPSVPVVFTARDSELARLRSGLTRPRQSPGPAEVWMITGAAGIGKTSLAVQAAHLVREHYPDGQLFLALQDTRHQPVEPAVALGRLLRALGVRSTAIPDDVDERAALYRAQLAERRVLIVLDNVAGPAQVRPLIPGTASSAILVTSRPTLAGLDAAERVSLDVLATEDAVRLLDRWVGADRVGREPEAAATIARYCGGLPLALRIAAAKLVARPHWQLSVLADRLADKRTRLAELSAGDLDVRAGLALSYDELAAPLQRTFRLLSRMDAADFPAWVAAPLLGTDVAEAEEMVEALADARLLDVGEPDAAAQTRFRLHDLTRAFGQELAEEAELPALNRLLDTWLALAEHTNRRIPHQDLCVDAAVHGPLTPAAETMIRRLPHDPLLWFDAEWPSLRAAVEQSARMGLTEHTWRLAAASAAYQDLRASYDDWDAVNRIGVDCLRLATGHDSDVLLRAEAVLVQQRGVLCCRRNKLTEAVEHFSLAQQRFAASGILDPDGAAYAWHGLGWMAEWHGRTADALHWHRRAIAGFTESGNGYGAVAVLCSLGAIARRAGEFEDAVEYLTNAMTTVRSLADDAAEMSVHLEQGRVERARGNSHAAARLLTRSLVLAKRLGDPDMAANVQLFLAEAHLVNGDVSAGRYEVLQALVFFQEHADEAGRAWAHRLLSQADRIRGAPDLALAHAEHAMAIELELPAERARAHRELACVLHALGRVDEALQHWDTARTWFEQSGFVVEADEIHREMCGIEASPSPPA